MPTWILWIARSIGPYLFSELVKWIVDQYRKGKDMRALTDKNNKN